MRARIDRLGLLPFCFLLPKYKDYLLTTFSHLLIENFNNTEYKKFKKQEKKQHATVNKREIKIKNKHRKLHQLSSDHESCCLLQRNVVKVHKPGIIKTLRRQALLHKIGTDWLIIPEDYGMCLPIVNTLHLPTFGEKLIHVTTKWYGCRLWFCSGHGQIKIWIVVYEG